MSKKKLAIPLDGENLSEHFGHSREFAFYKIENGKIVFSSRQVPPPHAEGTIPNWLVENEITDVLAGGIGSRAIDILNSHDINVYAGVETGNPDNMALDFIQGSLKYGKNYCNH